MREVRTTRQVERLPDGGQHRHLAALALTEGPEHQRIGVAWLDGQTGGRVAELSVDLAPGHADLRGAVSLVQQAAGVAAELGLEAVTVNFDPGRSFPFAVLQASGLPWRPGATAGSASIDVAGPDPTTPRPEPGRTP